METPKELDLGPINWSNEPLNKIREMLVKKGCSVDSLEQINMSRYILQQPLGAICYCSQHAITVHQDIILQSCQCNAQVLGITCDDLVYETCVNRHHHRYSRVKARPIRVPLGYKFIGLKSDTGTGKNKQIDVLLRALLYGQYNQYHTEADKTELEILRTQLGTDPGAIFIGPRYLYDLEMVRKLKIHGAQMYKDSNKYEDAPVWIWQFHSLWKFNKKVPKIVVIDEAELNVKVFTDSLNKNYQFKNQEMLEYLIQNADLVIVADATLSQHTVNVISKIDSTGTWFIQENTFKSNTGAIVRSHNTLESIKARCVMDLIAGKVLTIASGSLTKLDKFREDVCKCLPKNMLIKHKTFNSKTPGRDKDFEKGLDEALGIEFTMLLYTGSMGVGVEYTLEHVDKRYLLVNYNLVGADGYLQLNGRTRTTKEKTVEMFIAKPSRKQSELLPVSRETVKKQIDDDIKASKYVKTYFHPYMEPSSRKTLHRASKPWVEEALIVNTIQRNRSLNNMSGELFALLQGTGYTIEEKVHDNEPDTVKQQTELGCEGVNINTEEADVVTLVKQQQIEDEINILSYNERLELNLRYWSMYTPNLNEMDKLRKKYVRYRVDFPIEAATMETFQLIEERRDVLFNIACMCKLPDQSALYKYLFREHHSMKLENIYHQLTAMKILFGVLTATKDKAKVAHMMPPKILEGKLLEENMQQILTEIQNTGIQRLVQIRVRNNQLKKKQSDVLSMVKPVMGFVNQATKRMFGFTYKSSERTRSEGQRYYTWEQTPVQLLNGLSFIDVAQRSMLCTDINTPGHPPVPLPVDENEE
jgi:hypothetical protein